MPVKKGATKNEVAVVEKNEVAVVTDTPVMDDIDLGMLKLGVKIKMNKKGNFVGKEVEGLDLGDNVTGVITKTVFEYSLWRDEKVEGKGKIPEDANKLVLRANRPSEAEAEFDRQDEILGLTDLGYTKKNIKGRVYLDVEIDGSPYTIEAPNSTLIAYQNYASAVLSGAFGNQKFPTPTPRGEMQLGRINKVITNFKTEIKEKGDMSWIIIDFTYKGDVE